MRSRIPLRRPRLRTLISLLAVLVCACAASPAPRALVMRDVSFPLRDMRFPSGLRVIVEEDHRAPVVGVFMLVGAGSTSDPPGKEGLAHYVEHLAFRARPDQKTSIWSLLGRTGAGTWNATTGLDYTLYWEVGPKEALPALMTLEGVRLLAPIAHVTPETAATELDVVHNELRQRNETGFIGSTLGHMQRALFPAAHPYARPVIGTHESLAPLTLEDAQRFTRDHYRPENVTMVVVGDVDLATVNRVIEESLPPGVRAGAAGPPKPRLDPVAPPPPAPPSGSMARYQAALATPELWIGWTLPRSFDAEGYLDQFTELALHGGLPGAFWTDTDIAGFDVSLVPGKEAAMLLCRVALREASHPERSADHVLNQLTALWNWDPKFASTGLRPGELGRMRMAVRSRSDEVQARDFAFVTHQRLAVTSMLLDAEHLVQRGRTRAELTHFSGDPALFSRSLRAVMSLDASRVTDFAYKYLTRDRARSVLITPLPGRTPPPPGAGSAGAAPLDEAETAPDDASIARFIRAPGVSNYRRAVLANGLEVFVGRRAGLPVATVGLSLHGGSGSATPRGADELARRLARAKVATKVTPADFGGHLRDWYDRDDLTYLFEGSSGNVANMLELLAERVPGMRVDPEDVAFFRRETIPFLQRAEAHPEAQASRMFWSELYGTHPYGYTVITEDLEKLGARDADGWTDRVTSPKNAVLAIVGEVDPDEVLAQVGDTFGRWSRTDPPQAPPPPPALPKARAQRPELLVTHRPGASQGQLHFGCLLPPAAGAEARYATMASLLESRLFTTIRARLGASYGLHARVHTFRGGAAHLSLTGDVDNARLPKALAVLRSTLEALEQGHFAPGEVARARWQVARSYGVRYLTNDALVQAILRARNEDRDLASIDRFPNDLTAVTAEALTADYARCTTAPVLSIVGDEPTVRAALAETWP
ncbi:MAG: insulinase family protein [Minicystis sp.]